MDDTADIASTAEGQPRSGSPLHRPIATVTVAAPCADVYRVIVDPSTSPDWLLGAQKIRRIDAAWPQVGSSFHHTVGAGPLRISDHSAVLEAQAPEMLRLEAHIGVFGSAQVTFRLTEHDGMTEVELSEVPSGGLLRVGWHTFGRLWLALGLWGRNQLTLDRLRTFIENGTEAVEDGPPVSGAMT